MTTLQEMRDHVRLYLDLDEEDLPDIIFDQFVENGTSKIMEREANWPFLEGSTTFTAMAGQSTYDTAATFPDLEFLTQVTQDATTGPCPLDFVWTSYKSRHNWPDWGQTQAWTEYGGLLYLFPAPPTDVVLRVVGIKRIEGWTSSGPGASPPLPEPFHGLVLEWALAETYWQQDDPDNGDLHAAQFEGRLESQWRRYMMPRADGLKVGSVRQRATVGPPSLPDGF